MSILIGTDDHHATSVPFENAQNNDIVEKLCGYYKESENPIDNEENKENGFAMKDFETRKHRETK